MGLAEFITREWRNPEHRARWIVAIWLMSLGMIALGYAYIAWHYAQRGLPLP